METKQLTKNELVGLLEKSSADTIILDYTTSVRMNKKGNPFFHKEGRGFVQDNEVTKHIICQYGFGKNYTDEVNKSVKENSLLEGAVFEAKAVDWTETVVKDKVIRHKTTGTMYLKVFPDKEYKPQEEYLVDGNPADESQIETIKANEHKHSETLKTQEAVGLEKENQVQMITISFDNISEITIEGVTYKIV